MFMSQNDILPLSQHDKLINAVLTIPLENDEQWREINFLPEDINGKYYISNYGRVISLCRNKPIVLKPFLCGELGAKYCHVSLGQNDYKMHRLVAQAFIPNSDPERKTVVHHKDHNKLNNHVSNLEWVSQQENIAYYFQHIKEKYT